jgi:hypothetical protein
MFGDEPAATGRPRRASRGRMDAQSGLVRRLSVRTQPRLGPGRADPKDPGQDEHLLLQGALAGEYLFVLVGDGRQWFIPAAKLEAASAIALGGPKYAEYEVDKGAPLQSNAALGGCPSGQRERTVNAPAQPTQVRILLPPLRRAKLAPNALLAQLVEHFHGKEGVAGSSPAEGFQYCATSRFPRFRSGPGDHFPEGDGRATRRGRGRRRRPAIAPAARPARPGL